MEILLSQHFLILGRSLYCQVKSSDERRGPSTSRDHRIYVAGLDHHISEGDLKNFFSYFGNVRSAYKIVNRATGESRTFAYVDFYDSQSMLRAIQNKSVVFKGCKLRVQKYKKKDRGIHSMENSSNSKFNNNLGDFSPSSKFEFDSPPPI